MTDAPRQSDGGGDAPRDAVETGGDATRDTRDARRQRRAVRDRYARVAGTEAAADADTATDASEDDATDADTGCCSSGTTCCGDTESTTDVDSECGSDSASGADETAARLGYSAEEIDSVADGANLGLGCGNPQAIASLDRGETVLDLGSGAGFDCFLAGDAVGPTGSVIGVDMTPEMVERARDNARQHDSETVEFRLGEIEHLPVADATVDVVISNCVVNLSPDKSQVFREASRVLKPGGRLAISDVVRTAAIPEELRADPASIASCTAGAASTSELDAMLVDAGFEAVTIEPVDDSEQFIREWDPERDPSEYLVSARITARKPSKSRLGPDS